jgi:hypothetical protein
MLVALTGSACSGGEEQSRQRARRATRAVHANRAVPATTADAVAPPRVVDRGADHVAIARSLVEYGRWLEWHHPDPALVERAYAPAGTLGRNMQAAVAEMRRTSEHVVEVDAAPLAFVVLSERPNVVSFRLTERLAHRERVDGAKRVLQHAGPGVEHYVVSIMRFGPEAPWRLNFVEREGPPIEVQL